MLDFIGTDLGLGVHRALLLRKPTMSISPSLLNLNKKLVFIVQRSNELKLHFKNGAINTADALIDINGIFSSVRKHVLGKQKAVGAAAVREGEGELKPQFSRN